MSSFSRAGTCIGSAAFGAALFSVPACNQPSSEDPSAPADENPFHGESRYAAYLARARAVVVANVAKSTRYLAYSSDVGESLRPVLPPWAVNACYGLAFAYVGADVGYVGWKSHKDGKPRMEVVRAVTQELTFQTLASLLIPTVIIHTGVHQTQKLLKNNKNMTLVKWGPSAVGMALIPLMPFIDHPMEHAVEACFEKMWPLCDEIPQPVENQEPTAHADITSVGSKPPAAVAQPKVASPSAAAVPDSPDGSKQTASEQNQVAAVQARGTKSLNSKLQLEESSGTCAEKCPPQEHQLCGTSCKVTVGVILASVLVVAINKTGK